MTNSRGKKIFRKFEDDEEAAVEAGGDVTAGSSTGRRTTRSSIKPRLLFPPPKHDDNQETADDDEEAATDIEDKLELDEQEEPETPAELIDAAPGTPAAPKFAPASPPTTGRATRSGLKSSEDITPMKPPRGGKRSPFDSWRQTKSGSHSSHKRAAEALGTPDRAKRARA